MRYYVTISGRTFEVDLTGDEPRVDAAPARVDMATLPGTTVRHLLVDGRSIPMVADREAAKGVWTLHLEGLRLQAEVVDERTRAIREMVGAGAAALGPRPVAAPMPGLVVRVEVEAGQEVRAGQGLVIVEAMKMENELKAEVAGRVARVLVQTGQPVEKGTVLVEFEAD